LEFCSSQLAKNLTVSRRKGSEWPMQRAENAPDLMQNMVKLMVSRPPSQQDAILKGAIGSESSSSDFGPALPSSVPPKKKRKLPYEALYVEALPKGVRYSKSLMHKDQVASVTVAASPADFVITTSIDGVVKFWKKSATGIEFAKEYRAHNGRIQSSSASADGAAFATAGDEDDKTIKLFDVATFDLLSILSLESPATCICWVHRRGSAPMLAVAVGKVINVYDGRGERQTPLHTLKSLHRSPIVAMAYNPVFDCVLSADESGMIEYWTPRDGFDKPETVFKMKSSTNLFDFKKAKSVPTCISISPSGHQFATFSFPDRRVRIFDFASGKLHRSYDESLSTITDMQQAGTALQRLEEVEFGRRMATERELDNPVTRSQVNVIFDETGHFILYGSLLGIKVINTLTNRVVKTYGKEEPFRALNLAMYQGQPQKKGVVTVSMAASANPLLQEAEERDPMLFATGFGKVRFYMFTNEEQVSKSERDVQNEKPRMIGGKKKEVKQAESGTAAVLHTTYGDIHIRLFPDAAPKAVENFVTHAKNGYYNNTIFHRVIRKFMIQVRGSLASR
jgi:peptidylprolyl isomerase domain and WD repeat-containing protein 1